MHVARDQKQKPVVLPSALSVSQPQDAGSLTGLQGVTSGQEGGFVDFCLGSSSTLLHLSAILAHISPGTIQQAVRKPNQSQPNINH